MGSGTRPAAAAALALAAAIALVACTESAASEDAIAISGSSTVAPITEAVAADGGFAVDVAAEGTTAGFDRFCAGETAINNASEAIPAEHLEACEAGGVDFIELPIGLDTLSVVRHLDNEAVADLTLEELHRIWEPGSEVSTWSDVRPEWPEEEIVLLGRPEGSGTFDYFTHVVNGEAGAIREDYRTTNDLDELAAWVAEDENSLGFVGVGNYLAADEEARDLIATVAVDGIEPTLYHAQAGDYPMTRPLFVYVATAALAEDEDVEAFVEHYLDVVDDVLPRVFFYRLPAEAGELSSERFAERVTGSMYAGDPFAEDDLLDLLRAG